MVLRDLYLSRDGVSGVLSAGVAERETAKWHLDEVDQNKFKFKIREMDEWCAAQVNNHLDAVLAADANKYDATHTIHFLCAITREVTPGFQLSS